MHDLLPTANNSWRISDAEDLYRIREWGSDHFGISKDGRLSATLPIADGDSHEIPLTGVAEKLAESGVRLPALIRFPDIFAQRIAYLHDGFNRAIESAQYRGSYRGVFPIKVNQKQSVVADARKFGSPFSYGIEVGSKAELIAALSLFDSPSAYLICNGYKDPTYIRLALQAQKSGINVVLVVEMLSELPAILETARELGLSPSLGIRYRLTRPGSGRWSASNGESGLFGLSGTEIVRAVETLKEHDALQYLRLLHFHQGSQLPELNGIRQGVHEAARVYADLVREGAPMGTLNLGGGLAIDYDGTATASPGSCNYSLDQYCDTLVQETKAVLDSASISHPELITESGRAVSAHASVLVFEVFETDDEGIGEAPPAPDENDHPRVIEIVEQIFQGAAADSPNLRSQFNKWRGEVQDLFLSGTITLRQTALVQRAFEYATQHASPGAGTKPGAPPQILYANFSVFQSLPDHWALGQIFPVVPLHRLDEAPERMVILADLTCDSDGKVRHYIQDEDATALPAHGTRADEPYLFGAFLVGAYQETLGDKHNLFGAPSVVEVTLDGKVLNVRETDKGESTAEMLESVGYQRSEVVERIARNAGASGKLDQEGLESYLSDIEEGLDACTYLASPSSPSSK